VNVRLGRWMRCGLCREPVARKGIGAEPGPPGIADGAGSVIDLIVEIKEKPARPSLELVVPARSSTRDPRTAKKALGIAVTETEARTLSSATKPEAQA